MKKLNKIVLSIGAASAVVAPVVAVISCGSSHKKAKGYSGPVVGGNHNGTNSGTNGTGADVNGTDSNTGQTQHVEISTTSKPDDIYQDLASGFSLDKLLKDLPAILGNKNMDADAIMSLTAKLEGSGLIPDSIKGKIQFLLPDTPESAARLAILFKNGALSDIYTEVMNIMKTGVQGQLDTPEHITASTKRYAALFNKFKEAFPAIKDVDSDKAMAAVADVLQHGIGLSDESFDSILDVVKAVLPQTTLDSIHFDEIAGIAKLLKDKAISELTVPELKQIFKTIGEFVPAVKALDQDALASIINHLTNLGYTNFDDFKADLMKVLPDSVKNFKQDLSVLGTITFSEILKDIETRDTIKMGTGSDITKSLDDIVMHGLKGDSVNKLLSAVKNWRFLLTDIWPVAKGFLPETIGNLVQKVIDDRKSISGLANDLIHNPVLNIDGSEVDTIMELVNNFLGKSMPTNIGTPLVNLLNNAMFSTLSSVDDGLKAITELVKTLAKFEIPDSIMDIVNKIVPILLIGNEGITAQSTDAEREFSDMDPKVTEVKLAGEATMPTNYDAKTYSVLKAEYDLDEQKAVSGNSFEIDKAIADAKNIETKIIAYNDEITKANDAWTKLSGARNDFTAKYNGVDKKIAPMTAVADTSQKVLVNIYDEVSKELKGLYNSDVSKMTIEQINDAVAKITKLEPFIQLVNSNIENLNNDSAFDITVLTNKVISAGITVKGLSPLDPKLIGDFITKFKATSDDGVHHDKGGSFFWSHEAYTEPSKRAKLLDEFIVKNWGAIVSDKTVSKDRIYDSTSGNPKSIGNYERVWLPDGSLKTHATDLVQTLKDKLPKATFDELATAIFIPLGINI